MQRHNIYDIRSNHLESFEKMGSLLERSFIRLSEAGVDSKSYYYWKSKKLISNEMGRKWVELSGVEYVWIQILKTLQRYNCPIKTMQDVHNQLFTKAYEENLANRILDENINHFKKVSAERELTWNESAVYKALLQFKDDQLLQNHLRGEISYLYHYIIKSFREGLEHYIILLENGEIKITHDSIVIHESTPMLILPLSHYTCALILENQKESILTSSGFITEEEYSVIKAIRDNNANSITISFEKEDKSIKKIEYTSSGILSEERSREIMRILGIKNYSSISLKTRNGTTLSFEKKNMTYY